MAVTGIHIACGYVGGSGERLQAVDLGRPPVWSQTMPVAGVTSQVAPPFDGVLGAPCFEIFASVNVFVAIGPNPDAVAGPRLLITANETRNLFAAPGDRLAWVAA